MTGLRERKKHETRQRISDIATGLFMERGFDAVTVEEIAAAAGVSGVTVFNYFGRKEDLFFDRGNEDYEMARQALAHRAAGVSALRALQRLVHQLVKEESPLVSFGTLTMAFWRTTKGSPSLRARAREVRSEFERALAEMLQEELTDAPLVASMLVAAWCVAFTTALRRRKAGASAVNARKEFLRHLDRAFEIVERGTR